MPPEMRDGTDPKEWMRRARSSLALARAGRTSPEVLLEDVCFDAHQAAEKAIKAVLVSRGIHFRKSHDINELLTLAGKAGLAVPDSVKQADRLTHFAVQTRYPGLAEDVDEVEYGEALELADAVLAWAVGILGS